MNTCGLLVGKSEGKRPLGRPRRGLLDNIEMDLGEIGWSSVYWIGLSQDKEQWRILFNAAMTLWIVQIIGKILSFCAVGAISRKVQVYGAV
jgi:hypothetical protein